jgi:hypothetical protein
MTDDTVDFDKFCDSGGTDTATLAPLQTTLEFVGSFVPPSYLVDGILTRGFLYSMTGRTGDGKTAVALCLAAYVDRGLVLAGREVDRGRVLYLAGENPDDVRMRWVKFAHEMKIDHAQCGIIWRPGTMPLSNPEIRQWLRDQVSGYGDLALVIVDTRPAFFDGDDENTNTQMIGFAKSLRELTKLPGRPTVIAPDHPPKNANPDRLIPRGGGGFVAEVDGNLTVTKQPGSLLVEMHWQEKFRGPQDWQPITFQLLPGFAPTLVDAKGRHISTVSARVAGSVDLDEAEARTRKQREALIEVLKENPEASERDLARLVGWSYANGDPNKTLVHRTLQGLEADRIIKRNGQRWTILGKEKSKP